MIPRYHQDSLYTHSGIFVELRGRDSFPMLSWLQGRTVELAELSPSWTTKKKMALRPWKLTCPLKRDYFSREYSFQPLIFRGHASFQGATSPKINIEPENDGMEEEFPYFIFLFHGYILRFHVTSFGVLSIESWLFHRDPHNGLWNNPHITG